MVSLGVQSWAATTNVSDAGTGNSDLYKMSALQYTPATTIDAVTVYVQATNPAADAAHSVTAKLKSAGTVATSAPQTLVASNVLYSSVFPRDGAGNAWTLANLNAAQAGIGD